jgi:cell division protein FtsW (lipid II flippase)
LLTLTSLEIHDEINRREARLLGLAFAYLCLIALALAISPVVRAQDWSALGSRWMHTVVLPVWLTCAWLVCRQLRRVKPMRDPFLLPVSFMLAGWGMMLIWRLLPNFGARQTGWFIVAVLIMLLILRGPITLTWLRQYRYLWLLGGILLTALTLVFGTNPSGGEPRLWLGCCGVYIQPSEPLRLLLIAFMASFLADRVFVRWGKSPHAWFLTLTPLLLVWGVSIALLLVQRDLGMGSLFLMLLALMLYLITGRWVVLIIAAFGTLLAGVIGYQFIDVVHSRISTWLNPWADPIGSSYQLVQALISVASGGVFGRGPGLGSPGFVPVVHSDFVFTAVTEEWGLLGGLALIALFAILVSRGLRVAAQNRDPFRASLAAGVAIAFGLQAVLIMGGTTRLLPLAGLTLPFVSYGGSSLVTSFIGLSFLLLLSGEGKRVERFSQPMRVIQLGMILTWIGLALGLGWWTIYRAPTLTARTDNPRRALSALYSKRGSILDREGNPLAYTIGERGDFYRFYSAPWAASALGFESRHYGQAGIEKSMDAILRGEAGRSALEVWGAHLLLGLSPPGLDVRLTLDEPTQRIVSDAMRDQRGAVVVLEAASGEIRALMSAPSYDPNRVEEDWGQLISDELSPLLNRASQGQYQVGMAFAPLLTAWAIDEGEGELHETFYHGASPVNVDDMGISCGTHPSDTGAITLEEALRSACPRPYLALGTRLGTESLKLALDRFALDRPVLIRLESASQEDFTITEDDVSRIAIGQGDLVVSPLQMARAFASLLNGGKLPALHLVDAVAETSQAWHEQEPIGEVRYAVSEVAAKAVLEGLRDPREPTILSYNAQAVTGEEQSDLAWFLGANTQSAGGCVIVMVLEESSWQDARTLGGALLRTVCADIQP